MILVEAIKVKPCFTSIASVTCFCGKEIIEKVMCYVLSLT